MGQRPDALKQAKRGVGGLADGVKSAETHVVWDFREQRDAFDAQLAIR